MTAVNPHWQNGFEREVFHDRIVDKWWFRLELVSETSPSFTFESEVVYSTRDDAEQAADDASTAASMYQAHCCEPGVAA